jgi:pilus assembly protein Flp/PilA
LLRVAWHISCGSASRRRGRKETRDRIENTKPRVGRRAPEDVMELVNRVRAFVVAEDGQDLLEYALLVALIALVAIAAVGLAGNSVKTIFTNIAGQLAAAS